MPLCRDCVLIFRRREEWKGEKIAVVRGEHQEEGGEINAVLRKWRMVEMKKEKGGKEGRLERRREDSVW